MTTASGDGWVAPGHGPDEAPPADAETLPPGAVDAATRGLDAVLGREVAMVTLPPVRGEDLVVRTEQVRRLAGLHHAHLVEVFDVDGLAEDAESTLVLQSVDGRGLGRGTDRAAWSPLAVAEIGAQCASALAHAHARGVVHGRIGPESIVVGGTAGAPYAWLTGFTAALHPAPADDPAPAAASGAPAHPAGDLADLGRALLLLLDPAAPAAPALDGVLADMVAGRDSARGAADTLARTAEALRHVDEDETGLVPLVAAGPAPSTGVHGATARPGPAASSTGAATAAVMAGTGTGVATAARTADGRRARPGVRVALLGGAALALATASGVVLLAGEGPGEPEIGVSGMTTPERPVAPPAAGPPPGPAVTSATGADDTGETSERVASSSSAIADVTTRPDVVETPLPPPLPVTTTVPSTVPPTVPPVPPTTVPPTTVPPTTTAPTEPTGPTAPTTAPTTTTTSAPGTSGTATLAAP
jgi:hypothetical protein